MPIFNASFTYSKLTGKRKLRRYVWAALAVVTVIGVILVYSALQRSTARAEAMATPRPLVTEAHVVVQVTATPKLLSTATFEPLVEPCPAHSDEWTLVDAFPGDNLKRIAPECVYDGLAQTVAWSMLLRMGYTM